MTDLGTGGSLLILVRVMAFVCSLQFLGFSAAAALLFLGYYYRGWPEKISTVLARAVFVGSAPLPFTVPQMDPRFGPLIKTDWVWTAAFLVLGAASVVLNGYAYWKLYMPGLRDHPGYRGRGY